MVTEHGPLYDRIGSAYAATRKPDARHELAIHDALGDATSVVDVGAGTGSYEPFDRRVVAVEPSAVMIGQRPAGAAPVVRGVAEALPFDDGTFDAAMAILTVHHWTDPLAGVRELRRVARHRVVVFTADIDVWAETWIVRDYFPEIGELDRERFPRPGDLADALGGARIVPVPTPSDCSDGFTPAFWKRPHAYLDPTIRAGMSSFASLPATVIARGSRALERDLERGRWQERNAGLRDLDDLDVGHRLLVADVGPE